MREGNIAWSFKVARGPIRGPARGVIDMRPRACSAALIRKETGGRKAVCRIIAQRDCRGGARPNIWMVRSMRDHIYRQEVILSARRQAPPVQARTWQRPRA